MKKIVVALTFLLTGLAAWAQPARIPVNDLNTNTNTKPNNTTPKTENNNNTTTGSGELKKYSDPNGRFTIGYPTDWTFDNTSQGAIVKITSPSEGSSDQYKQSLNLQIEELKSAMTIEEYVKVNVDAVKDLMKGYKEVSSMYFNRNGARAYQIVYKGKYGDMAFDIQVKQLFIVASSKAYILTYISKEGERDAFETTANKIFNSFKL
ncbi:hypothetical protein ESA94_14705 [Lacibacter luteus]|uniref:PsbP C-terminal domain-containing protein n=1 Tax=Lacibacter luteus TaxID=2508719 RepID=A0A4Q1CHJ3_9BACT|nr:PsbP-related protein [Lacibacter luteus]RXK59381.1 hypothetical protein ESA94_14705 [Lacibacter luteus]